MFQNMLLEVSPKYEASRMTVLLIQSEVKIRQVMNTTACTTEFVYKNTLRFIVLLQVAYKYL